MLSLFLIFSENRVKLLQKSTEIIRDYFLKKHPVYLDFRSFETVRK